MGGGDESERSGKKRNGGEVEETNRRVIGQHCPSLPPVSTLEPLEMKL